ncbi:uncharacterized protein PADG_03092 [Paracoccidioides brasiliensis Pb18]|uniref:mRNA-capping enzyme subunit beta n=2 Tax=Paracoccidioides brasiliensis TaxID=121759 RepID=C1G7D7_PARBD|nr:uncharacterized protein PADG_03092 [Paracoccidioides brasiliensis Pb18]EEH46994.1 hypothetical protein PADG_03092 [Paracoccidioides brasiliensis Pb18]ODH20308.1 hypothetical protein ACO22_05918 [Paracoccidioides brasiliensis]
MDLRTIINNDAAGVQRPPASPHQPPGHDLDSHCPNKQRDNLSPASFNQTQQAQHPSEFRAKPPPPPPLQRPHRSSSGSSSYGSAQSPYQHTSASTLSSGPHSQGGQTLPNAIQTQAYPPNSRDPFPPTSSSSAYNQSAGPLSSPYTPQALSAGTQQSYFPQQRSQSVHSIQTPSSTHSYTYPSHENVGAPQQQSIQPQSQPFSPSQHRSHPGTPVVAPSAPLSRPSPHQSRPPSSGFDSQRRSLSGSWGSQDIQSQNKRDSGSPVIARHDPGTGGEQRRRYSVAPEARSVSVSPRTKVANLSRSSDNGARDHTPQPYRKDVDTTWKNSRNNAAQFSGDAYYTGDTGPLQHPPTTPKTPQPLSASRPPTISPPTKSTRRSELPSSIEPSHIQQGKGDHPPMDTSKLPSDAPKRKRRRYDEPPTYARKAPRTSGNPPAIPTGSNFSLPSKSAVPRHDSLPDKAPLRNRPLAPGTQHQVVGTTNGEAPTNGAPITRPAPLDHAGSSLGPWEPSITGVIPHEEVTKLICDFLFQQVVMRRDIGAAPAGGSAVGQDAILEVEAKLGLLIDRNRGERVRIPALTECIVAKDDPSIRVGFESSMSLAQHRALNDFLNDTVKSSLSQPGTRIPLTYAHKKERDTFYDISSSSLPPIIQHHLNPRHKPKVRVTTDQRTGAVLARIVKCRIADLDVFSPRTCLDWRISVNLEMNFEGDIGELSLPGNTGPQSGVGAPRGGARCKDRMSYRHLAYQIDLTQVAISEELANNPQSDFEHELEIEISSAEIRRQGDLALAGDPKNQYEELIKGFVDNIRVLARAVPGR